MKIRFHKFLINDTQNLLRAKRLNYFIMHNDRKTRWLHNDRIRFWILRKMNRKTNFTYKKKYKKFFINHSKTMKKNEKTNNETKNHNDFNFFEFKSTIQKHDFYQINNNFENWFRTHNKTTHWTIVQRRIVNEWFDRLINETSSKTFVCCK